MAARSLAIDKVWEQVRSYAETVRRRGNTIPTLTHEVPNRIVEVTETRIARWSPRVRGKVSYVRRKQVLDAWRTISRPGGGIPTGWYFLRPLLVNAFPGFVRHRDGWMWLEGDPVIKARKRARRKKVQAEGDGRGRGGEGKLHKELKEFILRRPNQALAQLKGRPFVGHDTEYLFETGDEVDVFLTDRSGTPVLVEVKPSLESNSRAPWGQAAKYRTLYAFFGDVPESKVRVVVAAPSIPARIATMMKKRHGIEAASVKLP